MKKFFLLSVLIILAIGLMAQTSQKHPKKTYVAPNGNFYINKALPVYLRLSTSSDAGAESHLLKSKVTEKYTNPMYFDTEGMNTVRSPYCVDPETRKTVHPLRDIIFEVYSDGLAPVTTSKFSVAPKYISGGTIYYGKNLVVNLTSKDAVSGVEQTFYKLDGSFGKYTSTVNLNKEGNNTLNYYAVDNVGNAENPRTKNFVIDHSAPKTNYSISGPQLNDIFSPKASITLTSSDNLSGVKKTLYKFDNKGEVRYYNTVRFSSLSDGEHTFTYYSIDNVKNAESKTQQSGKFGKSGSGSGIYKFYLDRTAPVVTTTIQGDQYMGNYKYISQRTKIKLTATDNKAGVESINYLIDYTGKTTYNSPFLVTNKKGLRPISYYGIDKVTNRSVTKVLTVYMDNVPPTTSIRYGTPQFFHRDTLFINKATKVTLTSRDFESGVQKTEYTIDGGGKTTYNGQYTIPNEGYRKIKFNAIDRVNNVEQMKESYVFVDNTPPVIYINLSIKPIGSKKKEGKSFDIYPNYTRLYVGATDNKTGTAKVRYSINGSQFKDYSSPYTLDVSELSLFKSKKFYTVTIKAKDKLGNESEKVVQFFVGKE